MSKLYKKEEKNFNIMFNAKKYSEGLEYFKNIKTNNINDDIDKNIFIANFYIALKRFQEAIKICNNNISIFKNNNSKTYIQEMNTYIIKVHSMIILKKYKTALYELLNMKKVFQNERNIIPLDNLKVIYSKIYSLKARCMFCIKEYDSSIKSSNLAIKYDKKNYDAYTTKIMFLYYVKRNADKCKKVFDYLINMDIENKYDLMNIYMMKGGMEGSISEYKESSISFQKAEKLSRNMEDKVKINVIIHLSAAFLANKEYNKALFTIDSIKGFNKTNKEFIRFINFNKGIILSKKIKDLNIKINSVDRYNNLLKLIRLGEVDEYNEPESITYAKANIYYSYIMNHRVINNIKNICLDLFGEDLNLSVENLVNIIKLIKYIYDFIDYRKVDSNDISNEYYQYTSDNILNPILNLNNDDKKFKLRLYNASYMNDSKEGKKLLIDISNNLGIDKKNSNLFFNQNKFYFDDVYISSLSEINPINDDSSMPLWNNYGDNHKGVSISFNIINDQNLNSQIDLYSDMSKYDTDFGFETLKNDFYDSKITTNAYRVVYSETEDGNELINQLSSFIFNLNDCLKDDNVNRVVNRYINKVKYLYKNSIYSYEKEVRIIKEERNMDKLYHDDGNPKLYTDLNDDDGIKISIKGITFGVNFDRPYFWYPLILKNFGKNFNINVSKMDYR